jgi:hypothetical protein
MWRSDVDQWPEAAGEKLTKEIHTTNSQNYPTYSQMIPNDIYSHSSFNVFCTKERSLSKSQKLVEKQNLALSGCGLP